MDNTARWVIVIALVSVSVVSSAEDNSFEGCLRRDSISCVQLHVYRKLRALFGRDNINLLGGFQLVKTEQARSLEDNTVDEKMFGETGVSERQTALEDFAYQRISNFFNERMFRWGLGPALDQVTSTARMAVSSIPPELKESLATYVVQGREKKKMLKSLVPILVMAKMKLVSLFGVAYVILSVIAKKALVASTIAIAITLFMSIKKLLSKHHSPVYYEIHTEPHGHPGPISHRDGSGWSPAWSSSGWDSYDPHAAHSSQHLAYSPQKPALR